jgi:protein-S-isoprenylcysteine O-methyltransferase Ste14
LSWLELRVPPPVVTATAGLLMWFLGTAFPLLDFELPARRAAAITLAAVGFAIGIAALFGFKKAKTTINPMTPEASTALVITGVYRLTRNPMYLAMLVVLGAWAVVVSNFAAFLLLPLFVAYLNRFQIEPEEQALQARFGAEFERYRRNVRRWL